MPEFDEITLQAFREELKTAALNPNWHGIGSGAGALGGLGAAAGGVIGGVRAYRQAREQGATGQEALAGSIGGAGRGALVGGAAGALAGGVAGHLSPGLGEKLTQTPYAGAPARFGQRQVHAVTGWEPKGGIEAIRGGAWQAKQNLAGAQAKAVSDVAKREAKGLPADKVRAAANDLHIAQADRAASAAQAGQDAGLTSIPGYVKALAKDPKGTISKGLKEQWHGAGPGVKALTVGLPALGAAQAALSDEGPDGPGKAERIGRGLLPAAAGMASGQLPFAGQVLVGGAAGAIGAGAGRAVDRLRGRKVPPPYKPDPPLGPAEVRVAPEAMMGASGGGEVSS